MWPVSLWRSQGCLGKAILVGVALLLLVLSCGVLSAIVSGPRKAGMPDTGPTAVAASVPTLVPTATPDWIAPPFEQICKKDKSMTDVQLEEHLKQFVGKKAVDWRGWVYDVTESSSGYTVSIAMDPPGGLLWSRDIEIVGISKDQALRLKKEQKVTFSGTIRKIGVFLGSICNPLTIEDGTIVE